jgi:hypothetical protein
MMDSVSLTATPVELTKAEKAYAEVDALLNKSHTADVAVLLKTGYYSDQHSLHSVQALILKRVVFKFYHHPYAKEEWVVEAAMNDSVVGFKLFSMLEPAESLVFAYRINNYANAKWIIDVSKVKLA